MVKKTHFDSAAKSWDTEETIKRTEAFAVAIKGCLSSDIKSVMDFGCGTGLLLEHFLNKADVLLGVENSSGMLEVFKERFKNHPKVSSLAINLEVAPFPFQMLKFDAIMSAMAFHHLKDPKKILSLFKEHLNPGGQVFLIDLDEEDGSFHPDNEGMGVFHFGFPQEILVSWAHELKFNTFDYQTVYEIAKNNRIYKVGMARFLS